MKVIILHQKHAAWHVYSLWPWIQKPFNSWVCVCAFNSKKVFHIIRYLRRTEYDVYGTPLGTLKLQLLPPSSS